jgi:peptide/nickel transport system permease protein
MAAEPAITVGEPVAAGRRTGHRARRAREVGRTLVRSKTFLVGAAILGFWILDAIFWRALVPYDPQALDPANQLASPGGAHALGTDNLGRDVLSRTLAGAASVLTVAPIATALGLLGGTIVGLVTGYYRGIVDDVTMRIVDSLLSFPVIVIGVLVLAVAGSSQLTVILVIAGIFTPLIGRTLRSAVLAERERDYVAAARLRGESGLYIMVVEILPNVTGPLAVEGTVRFGYAVFTSATLSFLGLGLQEPSPDWGLTISLGRPYLQIAWWIVVFPAIALATLVVSINMVSDGVRAALED